MYKIFNDITALFIFYFIKILKLPGLSNAKFFALLGLKSLQPLLAYLAPIQAFYLYRRAIRKSPAYKDFISKKSKT